MLTIPHMHTSVCVVVCCSVWQSVAMRSSVLQCSVLQSVAMCCSIVCCSVLQCNALWMASPGLDDPTHVT